MKYLLSTLITIMALGTLATASPVLAQTPDGVTPAEEAVCDGLKEDGVTKGLYGLCVAFCEAQDFADELDTITEEELITLETSTPSGRILANYNKKKQEGDPNMPCILVEEPCPCWTVDELAEVDGIMYDGHDTPLLHCRTDDGNNFIYERRDQSPYDYKLAQVLTRTYIGSCNFSQRLSPGTIFRRLSVQSGTLTLDQLDSCFTQINDHKAQYIGTKYCQN